MCDCLDASKEDKEQEAWESGDSLASATRRPVYKFSLACTSLVALGKSLHVPVPPSSPVQRER